MALRRYSCVALVCAIAAFATIHCADGLHVSDDEAAAEHAEGEHSEAELQRMISEHLAAADEIMASAPKLSVESVLNRSVQDPEDSDSDSSDAGSDDKESDETLEMQQKQSLKIVKRQVAAKKVYEKAKAATEQNRAKANSEKKQAESAFCDAEAELKKAVALHKKAKAKQHAAIKKVAQTISVAKDVMKAFEKAQTIAKENTQIAMTAARNAFDKNMQTQEKQAQENSDGTDDGGDDSDNSESAREELYTKAKEAEETWQEVNDTQKALVAKVAELFKAAKCPDKGGGGSKQDANADPTK